MAKAIHMMVQGAGRGEERRVLTKAHFGLEVADRVDFADFTLIYMKNAEADFEVELTVNKGKDRALRPRQRVRAYRLRRRQPRGGAGADRGPRVFAQRYQTDDCTTVSLSAASSSSRTRTAARSRFWRRAAGSGEGRQAPQVSSRKGRSLIRDPGRSALRS